MIENSLPHGRHIPNKPQPDKDRAGIPSTLAGWGIREQREEVKVSMEFDRGS